LQTFLQVTQQRAEFQSQINRLTSLCWDRCITGYPPSKMDAKQTTCFENCTERYFDVSVLLRDRFQSMLSKLQSH
uniref:Mitochondrial import inner membrane translocase subunit n=1 Tax=Echinostoma caproni TaxID=27848 RepID=A0A183BDY6_9TREM